MKPISALILATLVLTSCASTVSYSGKPTHRPTNPNKIEVVNINQLRRDYEILGECTTNVMLGGVANLKKRAASLGADAISIPEHRAMAGDVLACYAIKYKR